LKNKICELQKSQKDLSKLVGVSKQSIIAIDLGKFNQSLELTSNILKAPEYDGCFYVSKKRF